MLIGIVGLLTFESPIFNVISTGIFLLGLLLVVLAIERCMVIKSAREMQLKRDREEILRGETIPRVIWPPKTINQLLFFATGTLGLVLSLLNDWLKSTVLAGYFTLLILSGIFVPIWIGYVRGAKISSNEERARGWIYLVFCPMVYMSIVGLGYYIYSLHIDPIYIYRCGALEFFLLILPIILLLLVPFIIYMVLLEGAKLIHTFGLEDSLALRQKFRTTGKAATYLALSNFCFATWCLLLVGTLSLIPSLEAYGIITIILLVPATLFLVKFVRLERLAQDKGNILRQAFYPKPKNDI